MHEKQESGEQCMSLVPPHCTVRPNHIAVYCHMTCFLMVLPVLIMMESQDFFVATAVVKLFSFTSQRRCACAESFEEFII